MRPSLKLLMAVMAAALAAASFTARAQPVYEADNCTAFSPNTTSNYIFGGATGTAMQGNRPRMEALP